MKPILLFLFCICTAGVYAQNSADTIYKHNGEVLLVKIVEIGIDEVKYKPVVNPNDLILVIEKSEIKRIVFSNGISQVFADPMKDMSFYEKDRRNNIKFNFLSPIGDRLAFHFERSLRPGMSYELGINAIGLGKRYGQSTPIGLFLDGGIRLYIMPEIKSRSDRYSHLMNGTYFQPSITLGATRHKYDLYQYNTNYPYNRILTETKTANTAFFMFFLNFGHQFIVHNRLSVDFGAGIGYGTYTNQSRNYGSRYSEYARDPLNSGDETRFGFAILERETPLAFNLQFKMGYLLK